MGRSVLQTADRLANVVRYHRPQQLARRLWNRVSAPIDRRLPRRGLAEAPPVRVGSCPPNRYAGAQADFSLQDLAAGRLRLLNLSAELGRPFAWDLPHWPDAPPLWRFHLHYHEYLAALAEQARDAESQKLIWSVVDDWIVAHPYSDPRAKRVAWHPYCISRRVPVWAQLYRKFEPDSALQHRLRLSLAQQVQYLSSHLERDIGGNHLWENAKAIVAAACFFDGPIARRWLNQGLSLLWTCIEEQLSSEGEHFEKAPGYQVDLAEGLLDLANWLRDVDRNQAEGIASIATRMVEFSHRIRHPDGGVPLFGDSTLAHVPELSDVDRSFADGDGWVGDYYVHRDRDHHLVFDAGDIGPDELPAHSHADLLGFEASVYGRRLFVDGGIYSYTGPKRGAYRASQAHNVLMIDGRQLADVWSSFRVGRRGHVVKRASGGTPEGTWAWAAHDAYRRWRIPAVERLWFFAKDGPWFSMHVIRKVGGEANLEEFLHLHPEIEVQPEQDGLRLLGLPGPARIEWDSSGQVEIQRTHYSPDFYTETPRTTLAWSRRSSLPAFSAWCLSRTDRPARPRFRLDGDELHIEWEDQSGERSIVLPLPQIDN